MRAGLIGWPLVGGQNLIYQFWLNTEAKEKMPRWFEAVMNTSVTTVTIMAATQVVWIATMRAFYRHQGQIVRYICALEFGGHLLFDIPPCQTPPTQLIPASSRQERQGGVIPTFWVRRGLAIRVCPPLNLNA